MRPVGPRRCELVLTGNANASGVQAEPTLFFYTRDGCATVEMSFCDVPSGVASTDLFAVAAWGDGDGTPTRGE